ARERAIVIKDLEDEGGIRYAVKGVRDEQLLSLEGDWPVYDPSTVSSRHRLPDPLLPHGTLMKARGIRVVHPEHRSGGRPDYPIRHAMHVLRGLENRQRR